MANRTLFVDVTCRCGDPLGYIEKFDDGSIIEHIDACSHCQNVAKLVAEEKSLAALDKDIDLYDWYEDTWGACTCVDCSLPSVATSKTLPVYSSVATPKIDYGVVTPHCDCCAGDISDFPIYPLYQIWGKGEKRIDIVALCSMQCWYNMRRVWAPTLRKKGFARSLLTAIAAVAGIALGLHIVF